MSTFTDNTSTSKPSELNISPSVGIRRVIFNNPSQYNKCKWSKCVIYMSCKTYETFVCIQKTKSPDDFGILLRPYKKYEDSLFEQVFGFKCKCMDYNHHQTIGVRASSFTYKVSETG